MKSKLLIAVLGAALAMPALALARSASESMHEAGTATENSAASAGHAIVDVYHGTKTATIDTTITAKVKTALDGDATTKHEDIHVKTVDGVVTLRGKVSSASVADRAVHLAEHTSSVRSVRNKLMITTAAN
jgi:hyperosmotically inducible periplasmic protein